MLVIFTLSGVAALVYELLWARRLHLVLGSSTEAVTAVLAAYMSGLALGSALLGRVAGRVRRPLRLYGLLEIAIALAALALPAAFNLLDGLYAAHYEQLAAVPGVLHAVRFLSSFAVLLIPTALMGGTLPALARHMAQRDEDVTRSLARLYALNTLGAATGAVFVGFALVYVWGVGSTTRVAAAINLAVGVAAILLARNSTAPVATAAAEPEPAALRLVATVRAALILGGIAALAYEVAWTRALILVVGATNEGFATVLVTFLAGLGLGSLAAPLIARHASRERLAAVLFSLHIAVGLASLALTQVFDGLPTLIVICQRAIETRPGAAALVGFITTGIVLLLPTALMGAAFPLAARLLTGPDVGRDVGGAYALATVGNIAGALGAGLFLVPWLGTQRTLEIAASLSLAAGLAGLLGAQLARPRRLVAAAAFMALVAIPFLPRWDPDLMGAGVWYYPEIYQRAVGVRSAALKRHIVFFKEGRVMLVTVSRDETNTILAVNGKVDASRRDSPTQLLLGYLPGLLHPAPRQALVVGFGSGATAAALLRVAGMERLTTVEIEPAIIEASRHFADLNHGVLRDPRHRLVLDDARAFYAGTSERFDLIVSEPSNPVVAGVPNLYTEQAFRLARRALAPGGLMCQWLQAYRVSPDTVAMVVASFARAFPTVTVWNVDNDLMLIGSEGPFAFDAERIQAVLGRSPELASDLKRHLGVTSPSGLLAYLALGPAGSQALAEDALVHSDDRPLLEAVIRRPYRGDQTNPEFLRRFDPGNRLAWLGHTASVDEVKSFAAALYTAHRRDDAVRVALTLVSRETGEADPDASALLGDAEREGGSPLVALSHYQRALLGAPGNLRAAVGQAKVLADQGFAVEAFKGLTAAGGERASDRETRLEWADLLERMHSFDEARHAWDALRAGAGEDEYLVDEALGRIALARRDFVLAKGHLELCLANNPYNLRAKGLLATALAGLGDNDRAVDLSRDILAVTPDDLATRLRLMQLLGSLGRSGEIGDLAEQGLLYAPGNLDLITALHEVGRRVF